MCGLLKLFGVEKEYYLPFFIDFDSQMDILKVYLEYLPKMFRYYVEIPVSGNMAQDEKVSKYCSHSDVDDGDYEADIEVMETNEERDI